MSAGANGVSWADLVPRDARRTVAVAETGNNREIVVHAARETPRVFEGRNFRPCAGRTSMK